MGNWSELQEDLLVLIAKQIAVFKDFVSFGGVCRSWRLVAVKQNFKVSQHLCLPKKKRPVLIKSAGQVAVWVELHCRGFGGMGLQHPFIPLGLSLDNGREEISVGTFSGNSVYIWMSREHPSGCFPETEA
ncbi:hypothetical protein Vadar_034089 [Vaccinium darrowii]|uniref:Uncharacterized protein n=1 Tax=Vaccinium darrowii TaxID=229202 RepID=A0ACB7XM02_9ERIC|nr:hypothetical protein Vadar_034089 [Vaccinium darrowii]